MCFGVFYLLENGKCGYVMSFLFFFNNGLRVSFVNRRWFLWFKVNRSFMFESVILGYVERVCVLELDNCIFKFFIYYL